MFRLKNLNVVRIVESELSRDNLLSKGFELIEDKPPVVVETQSDTESKVIEEEEKEPIKKSKKSTK